MRVIRSASWTLSVVCCLCVASVRAEGPAAAADAGVANKPTKKKKSKSAPPPSAAESTAPAKPPPPVVSIKPAPPSAAGAAKPAPATQPALAKPTPPPSAAKPAAPTGPTCSIEEPEQPRGGRLEVIGQDFGEAPVVRIAERPARMLERRSDRIAVQVPPDSNGGAVTLQNAGRTATCGNLTIIGKNR